MVFFLPDPVKSLLQFATLISEPFNTPRQALNLPTQTRGISAALVTLPGQRHALSLLHLTHLFPVLNLLVSGQKLAAQVINFSREAIALTRQLISDTTPMGKPIFKPLQIVGKSRDALSLVATAIFQEPLTIQMPMQGFIRCSGNNTELGSKRKTSFLRREPPPVIQLIR